MDSRGFTLVEMMVALLAASLLLIPLGWMVGQLGNRLDTAEETDKISFLDDKLLLQNLIWRARFTTEQNVHITQNPMSLKFLGPLPQSAETSGLALWTLQNSENGLVLQNEQNQLPAIKVFPEMQITSVTFLGDKTYPKAIALMLLSAKGRTRELIFKPRITGDALCDYDLVTQSCR
jgi:prepilin-type N-terminal cleavage/methylation domain-containing protein